MPDITMCNNETCPIKETCYRWTAEPNEFWQAYNKFEWKTNKKGALFCENGILDKSGNSRPKDIIDQIMKKMGYEL